MRGARQWQDVQGSTSCLGQLQRTILITAVMFSSHLLCSYHTCYILITAVIFSSHLLHSLHTCVPHPQTYAEVLNTNAIPLRPSVVAVRFLSCALLFVALWTADHQATCPWDFSGKNTRVDCHFILQGIFPSQGLNSCLLRWQVGSLAPSQPGGP